MVPVAIVLLVLAAVGCVVWITTRPTATEPPPTEAELLQARLDLHRLHSGVDLTLAKQEARREAEQTKRAIADALEHRRRW